MSARNRATVNGTPFKTVLLSTSGLCVSSFATFEAGQWTLATLRTWWFTTVSAIFLSAMISAQSLPGSERRSPPVLNDAIVKVADSYRRAVLAGDAQAVAATYRDDGVELPPHHPLVQGRTAIEERFRGLFTQAKVIVFTFMHLETTVDGNTAYDAGTYEQRLVLPSGQVVNDTGKYLAILKPCTGPMEGRVHHVQQRPSRPIVLGAPMSRT